MKRVILSVIGLSLLLACSPKGPEPTSSQAAEKKPAAPAEDSRVKKLRDRIAQNTPEGNQVVEKLKAARLTINGSKSAVPVGEIADRFAKQPPNVGIGWEAFKNQDGTFYVWYHFKNREGNVLAAKWLYDPKTSQFRPEDRMGTEFSYLPN